MRHETQRHANSLSVFVCSDGVRLEPGVHPAVQDIGVHPRQTNVGFLYRSTPTYGRIQGTSHTRSKVKRELDYVVARHFSHRRNTHLQMNGTDLSPL